MNAAQIAQFTAASGHSPSAVLLMIAHIIMVLLMLWVVWVGWGYYRAWHTGGLSAFDMTWGLLRATVLLLILGYFLRP